MNKKLREIVVNVPDGQVAHHLAKLSGWLRDLACRIGDTVQRSNASVAYANLAGRTADELVRLSSSYPGFAEGAAWSARNIFEMNLIVRYIGRSDANMNLWLGQRAGDEKQIIQGFLSLSASSESPERETLQRRLMAIDEISARHGIQPGKPFNIKSIAEQERLADAYDGLYKLFSKYVHPSSWLVNSPTDSVCCREYMNIFLAYSQVHSGDTYSRVSDWLASSASAAP